MRETWLRDLTAAVLNDPCAAERRPDRLTYVARFSGGVASEFGFFYSPDGAAEYWAPQEWNALDLAHERHQQMRPAPERTVLVLRIVPLADEVRLTVLHDAEAAPWFVPVGREDDLAELAR